MYSFLLSLLLSTVSKQVKPQPKFPAAIDVIAPNYHCKQRADSLRNIDFRNLDLVILDRNGVVDETVHLRKGEFHQEEKDPPGPDRCLSLTRNVFWRQGERSYLCATGYS